MIQIDGGCQKCGRMTNVTFDVNNVTGHIDVICASCHSKYYSMEAVRDAKLQKLLKRTIWMKIKDFVGVGKHYRNP
jgi:predicted metal-binding protein